MNDAPRKARTLSYRAVMIGIAAMVVLAIWVHFREVMIGGTLVGNNPPVGAVGIFIGVLCIGGIVAWLRPRLRLAPGELVVIYAMLVVSAPLMGGGLWHRLLAFMVAIPDQQDNLPLVDSYSEKLWPHGPHLVADRRFAEGVGHLQIDTVGKVLPIRTDASPVGATTALSLVNEKSGANSPATLRLRVDRHHEGRHALVPGSPYYVTALVRLTDMSSRSRFTIELISDGGESVLVESMSRDTQVGLSTPGRFVRKGQPYVIMPRDVREHADLVFTLHGAGSAAVTDVVCFSNAALHRLHQGSSEIAAADLARLPENERDNLLVRPDRLLSPAGFWYLLKGAVPHRQWFRPMAYWLSIVLAMFFCLLGLGVIFRRQWAEHERFTFPMLVLPRLILDHRDEAGRLIRPLLGSMALRIGFAIGLIYCLMQGLAQYVPGLPDPTVYVILKEYFDTPGLKSIFKIAPFHVVLMYVAIAFFVDLELLFSILLFTALTRCLYGLGEVYGWRNVRGPIDNFPFAEEQHLGAFLMLALVVIWISRKHLVAVARRVLGLPGGADDSGEAMRYRTAALLIGASFVFFAVWGAMTGLGSGAALLFFGFLVVCGLSASRIRTECGAPTNAFTPQFPFLIFYLLGGLWVFGSETMVLAYCAGGFMAVAGFLMFAPTQVEMLQFASERRINLRGVNTALVVGILGGLLLGGYVLLGWAHSVGGEGILDQDRYFTSLRQSVARADKAVLASSVDGASVSAEYPVAPIAAVGSGAAVTGLLTAARARFVGFWLHPIGFVLANTRFIHACWGSILVACLIKWVALKLGGPRLVREQMVPMFAGVFIGGLTGVIVWDFVAIACLATGRTEIHAVFP
ncbi:MAG: hypothetical protein CMJ18_00855 [Phycisphaeraceae bacterium]|nr:hypothetical protein [Phycisphaeraceae bacterium]